MPDVWTPGPAYPLDELVDHVHRRIAEFAAEHGLAETAVSVELADGSVHRLAAISPEPGSGFLTLVPHAEGDEGPSELIVSIARIAAITLRRAEPEARFGFSLPETT